MNRSLTLLVGVALWCSTPLCAQSYTESFEGGIVPSCATLNNAYTTIAATEVINGTGSLYSNPPVNGSGTRDYYSPYLNIASANVTISYWYKLNQQINAAGALRFVEVGLQSLNGAYISLHTLNLTKESPTQLTKKLAEINRTIPSTGVYRLAVKMGGSLGDGAVRLIIDDITINANPYYSSLCNAAPIAVDDNYASLTINSFSDNVISNTVGGSDNDPNGENLSAILITSPDPAVGSITLQADGSFVFTPAIATFRGGPVMFTYRLTDNGYAPAMSNIATVTINYPVLLPLPIQLHSFTGRIMKNKAQLQWEVSANETGEHFQILRSADGTNYTEVGMIKVSTKAGEENYAFSDAKGLTGVTYYKIKISNKDNSTAYSNVVALSPDAVSNSTLQLLRNPVVSTLTFTYTAQQGNNYKVRLYTAAGVAVWSRVVYMQKGENTISQNLDIALPVGMYVLEVSYGSERYVTKLVKR